MKIGIIGTGNIGGTLARKLAAAGHEVRVTNSKGAEGVRSFAEEIGAVPVDIRGTVDGVDAVITSIPLPALEKLPKDLFSGLPSDVPVIDTSNSYPDMRDPRIAEIDQGLTESEWVSGQIGRPVVKAFNNILANTLAELGRPEGSPDRLAGAVAGDDATTKKVAMDLMNQIGFNPVDAGPLSESWRQQPSTPVYCCDYDAATTKRALAAAVKEEAPAKRDRLPALMGALGTNPTHEQMVRMNRDLNPLV